MPTLTIDELDIHYLHHLPCAGVARQRVLYIHGTGCNARVFADHLRALGGDYELAAIDLPGHGQSGGRGFRGVADYAAVCAGLVRALGWHDCVAAGHSLGGGVALAMAVYDAELVRALIMIDSGARLRVAPAIMRGAQAVARGAAAPRLNPRQGFADTTADTVVAAIRALTRACDPAVIARDWIAADGCDFMSRLESITVPVLAVCGRDDQLTPLKYHEYLQAHLVDCSLQVIEGAAHWPFVEQAAVFTAHVRHFLDALD